jgi:hypothetical protein
MQHIFTISHEKERNAYYVLVGKQLGKREFRSSSNIQENMETGREEMARIQQENVLVMVINHSVL